MYNYGVKFGTEIPADSAVSTRSMSQRKQFYDSLLRNADAIRRKGLTHEDMMDRVLVYPLLTSPHGLGWHPAEVIPELSIPYPDRLAREMTYRGEMPKRSRPDYHIRFYGPSATISVIERKRLQSDLDTLKAFLGQLDFYQRQARCVWGILTDGEKWVIKRNYEVFQEFAGLEDLLRGMDDFRATLGRDSVLDRFHKYGTADIVVVQPDPYNISLLSIAPLQAQTDLATFVGRPSLEGLAVLWSIERKYLDSLKELAPSDVLSAYIKHTHPFVTATIFLTHIFLYLRVAKVNRSMLSMASNDALVVASGFLESVSEPFSKAYARTVAQRHQALAERGDINWELINSQLLSEIGFTESMYHEMGSLVSWCVDNLVGDLADITPQDITGLVGFDERDPILKAWKIWSDHLNSYPFTKILPPGRSGMKYLKEHFRQSTGGPEEVLEAFRRHIGPKTSGTRYLTEYFRKSTVQSGELLEEELSSGKSLERKLFLLEARAEALILQGNAGAAATLYDRVFRLIGDDDAARIAVIHRLDSIINRRRSSVGIEGRVELAKILLARVTRHESEIILKSNLGVMLAEHGSYEEGARFLEESLADFSRLVGPSGSALALRHSRLGNCYLGLGRFEEALREHKNVYELFETQADVCYDDRFASHWNLGDAFAQCAQAEDAIRHYDAALDLMQARGNVVSLEESKTIMRFFIWCCGQGWHGRIRSRLEWLVAAQEHSFGPTDASVAVTRNMLGNVHRFSREQAPARQQYEAAKGIFEACGGLQRHNLSLVLRNLSLVHAETDDRRAALEQAEAALALLAALGPSSREEATKYLLSLGKALLRDECDSLDVAQILGKIRDAALSVGVATTHIDDLMENLPESLEKARVEYKSSL